jgi:hypothetical protein
MKKIIATAVMVTALVGCGTRTVYVNETTDAPDATKPVETDPPVETTVKITQPPYVSQEDLMLEAIKKTYGKPIYADDSLMVDIAYIMCDHFRSGGNSWTASALIVDSLPNDPDTQLLATIITAASVAYLCPDQGYKLQ